MIEPREDTDLVKVLIDEITEMDQELDRVTCEFSVPLRCYALSAGTIINEALLAVVSEGGGSDWNLPLLYEKTRESLDILSTLEAKVTSLCQRVLFPRIGMRNALSDMLESITAYCPTRYIPPYEIRIPDYTEYIPWRYIYDLVENKNGSKPSECATQELEAVRELIMEDEREIRDTVSLGPSLAYKEYLDELRRWFKDLSGEQTKIRQEIEAEYTSELRKMKTLLGFFRSVHNEKQQAQTAHIEEKKKFFTKWPIKLPVQIQREGSCREEISREEYRLRDTIRLKFDLRRKEIDLNLEYLRRYPRTTCLRSGAFSVAEPPPPSIPVAEPPPPSIPVAEPPSILEPTPPFVLVGSVDSLPKGQRSEWNRYLDRLNRYRGEMHKREKEAARKLHEAKMEEDRLRKEQKQAKKDEELRSREERIRTEQEAKEAKLLAEKKRLERNERIKSAAMKIDPIAYDYYTSAMNRKNFFDSQIASNASCDTSVKNFTALRILEEEKMAKYQERYDAMMKIVDAALAGQE